MRYACGLVIGSTLVILWNVYGHHWLRWQFTRGDR